ncbi:MAG: type II toxin-antitoxin system VapC family toxin [Betaproteobacteria bacterium]|nr:MAG: type II toxin-antitoxin system VapC family toxin [Betaproteobacteria bacterium]
MNKYLRYTLAKTLRQTTLGTKTVDAWTTSLAIPGPLRSRRLAPSLRPNLSVAAVTGTPRGDVERQDRAVLGALIDTSVWIAIERNEINANGLSETARGLLAFTSPIVVGEIKHGVERALTPVQRKSRQDALDSIMRHPVIAIDAAVAVQWGVLSAQLFMQGATRRRSQDLWLAATAIARQLCLITLNPRDFNDIPGLLILVPPRKPALGAALSPQTL